MKWAPWKLPVLFYLGLLFFIVYEILKVYFIMPLPGSQESNTLQIAYFLHQWRLVFRLLFALMLIFGFVAVLKRKRKWIPITLLFPCILIIYMINTKMQAEKMFRSPKELILASSSENRVDTNSLVIGIEINGQAKAYPIKFIAYHHIVYDVVGNEPVIITYCNVCHSGRIFDRNIKGKEEKFRLVGMDHYNAMFEDRTTHSWWRQATGECVAGKLKGEKLQEKIGQQMTVAAWYQKYPDGKVMQPDPNYISKYDMTGKFEQGKDEGRLTRTDSLSWKEKSLVVGVTIGSASKAYDWNELVEKKVINDEIAKQKIVVVTNPNGKSFSVFLNTTGEDFQLEGDMLRSGEEFFDVNGIPSNSKTKSLTRVHAYQEFWHSWKTFHPATKTYPEVDLN